MHPTHFAKSDPDKPAIIMADTGETMSYAEMEAVSNRFAHFLRGENIHIGDMVALCLENHLLYLPLCWGAQRAGCRLVVISSRLTASEVSYILKDSAANILIGSAALSVLMDALLPLNDSVAQWRLDDKGVRSLNMKLAQMPTYPINDERAGTDMLYSSGTTGRPKGISLPFPEDPAIDGANLLVPFAKHFFGFQEKSRYLSPAPLYHAAPLRWCMVVHRLGGTTIIMRKFDAEDALKAIAKYKVNVSQWVPTHFVRMLKLPKEVRELYTISSMQSAVHAAAPIPVAIKEAMIKWWGPILNEYYAGSEGNGLTFINSEDWLTHKGSVGRAILGIIHICDENGEELPFGEVGQIYFEGGAPFSYHNDPEKTASVTNQYGWTSLGDIGHMDKDGFLYLTDRKSFTIISGGVNIYPQEIENLLIAHDKVIDAAVIGAPDPDMGEKIVAIIQPRHMAQANEDLANDLEIYLRRSLSGVKIPRLFEFRKELPRHQTGKLYKRLLREEYWQKEKNNENIKV